MFTPETFLSHLVLVLKDTFPGANRPVVKQILYISQTQTINYSNLVEKCATCTAIDLRSSVVEQL